mgnify:CR=1 FL=1
MSKPKLFLLDGHALVYRAHYAFITRPLINSKGWNTSAINGFVRMLWDLIRKEKPTHIAVAFDLPTPTFRHIMYESYKAHRDAQPEDITFALPYIQKILTAFKIPILTLDGYEADDVIGTIAKKAEKEDFQVFMMTPDKDYAQLVSENIFIYKPSRSGTEIEVLGVPEVLEEWKIKKVDQVIDILGLEGDKVDNIPGIPGIGEKTAIALIEKYGSIETLLQNTADLKGKQKENVENFADQGLLSKKLATIDIDVPIEFNSSDYTIDPFDRDLLNEIFVELEFRTLANAILGSAIEVTPSPRLTPKPISDTSGSHQYSLFDSDQPGESNSIFNAPKIAEKNIENTPHHYHLADTMELRQDLIQNLIQQVAFCYDSESTDIDANMAEIVGMSFSIKPHEAWYVPIPEVRSDAINILEEFRPLFENEKIIKVGQNIKYDAILLKRYGIDLKGNFFDTMIAHYLIEPELRHNMNYMSETYLKYAPISIETLIGSKGKLQGNMRDVSIEKIKEYAAEDADITLQLKDVLSPKLQSEGLIKLFDEMECPLIKVLVDMEYEGINLDKDYLHNYSKELTESILVVEDEIYTLAGLRFNIASPKQVGEVLFEHLKIPYTKKKTKTGQYVTDEDALNDLNGAHQVIEKILKYRGLMKLKSTYVDSLPKMVNPKTGRIHSSFNQALTATGRLSSNNPNLQNIPIKTKEGSRVREAFIARDEDHILLSADYSQIELRLIAEISGDTSMLEAFKSGHDIHKATAAKVYNVALDDVSATQRRNAKTVNFSIIYGAGAQNLSQQLGIPRAEAKQLIEQYFTQYSGLKNYMEKTVEFARNHHYVATLMGRRRYLRDIDSRNSLARSNAERMAINSPIQGTAADLIKMAMIKIHQQFKEKNLQSKLVLQVHDELVFDVLKSELETVRPIVKDCMQHAIEGISVPILVETGVGDNWREAH